jgi:HSP20 family protein
VIEKKLPAAKEESAMPPFFVEAEKLFERFADISKETAQKAFDFFRQRGGEFGRELEDWFNAESKVLRFVPMEVTRTNGTIKVTADTAGFKPEEIQISVDGKTLMISGESENKKEEKNEDVVYSDFESNRFFRQMTLPSLVDAGAAKAEVKDGMLTISLPAVKDAEPKQIAVSAG